MVMFFAAGATGGLHNIQYVNHEKINQKKLRMDNKVKVLE